MLHLQVFHDAQVCRGEQVETQSLKSSIINSKFLLKPKNGRKNDKNACQLHKTLKLSP